jgi:hypothetical protein
MSDKSWASRIRHEYGLSPGEYNRLLIEQNRACAICHKPVELGKKRLAVDHHHLSGKARGLLCSSCNLLLGLAYEKIEILTNAIEYLKKHYDEVYDVDSLKRKLIASGFKG